MDSFTLLYLLYSVKLSSQASIYFIWLADSSSQTIAFIAAAVALFAVVPFFHVMVHLFAAKPLSNSTFIAYLCFSFPLAILWYKPTQGSHERVLPFAIVTALDLLDLLIFLFQPYIGHLHIALTPDMEHGRLRSEALDDISVSLEGRGNEQSQHTPLDNRSETSRTELHRLRTMQGLGYDVNVINCSGRAMDDTISFDPRSVGVQSGIRGPGVRQSLIGRDNYRSTITENIMQRPESVGWNTEMVHTGGDQEMEEVNPQQGPQGFFINLGMSTGSENPISSQPPTINISDDLHPVYRPTSSLPACT